MPAFWSAVSPFRPVMACLARSSATPPPGTTPSSTAARVACKGVFDAGLLFLHFDFGGSTDANHGNAAGQLGHALLQLLAVVVRGGFSSIWARICLTRASIDFAVAGAVDDRGVFLGHFDALGLAQILQRGLFQRHAGFFGRSPCRPSGWRCLPAWPCDGPPKPGALTAVVFRMPRMLFTTRWLQRFAFDVFGDDQQRTARLGDCSSTGSRSRMLLTFFVVDQDIRIVQRGDLLFRAVDEVGRQVAAVGACLRRTSSSFSSDLPSSTVITPSFADLCPSRQR